MKEQIKHPEYYQLDGGLETIDVIDALGLGSGFALGNAIKYIFRAGKKSEKTTKDDIKKAIWYLEHYINYLKNMEKNIEQTDASNEPLMRKSKFLEQNQVTS